MNHREVGVIVFAKPAVAGRCKTRLGATLGMEVAAELSGAFLADTWSALTDLPWATPILATPAPQADHGVAATRWDQGGGDLGHRLQRVLARGLAEFPSVIALGSDTPGLPGSHLEAVRRALTTHSSALGPCDDGGFWALGLTQISAGLLLDLPWSAETTCAATRVRLAARGHRIASLPEWFDIDDEPTLRRWRTSVPRARAPRTHALVDHLGWDAP